MAKWDREHVLYLITLYKEHFCLYYIKHKDYHNRNKREDALNCICDDLEKVRPTSTVFEIKTKIRTLRSQYSSEKSRLEKSKKSGAGADEIYEPKFWCFQELTFLDNYTKERSGTSNIDEVMIDRTIPEEASHEVVSEACSETKRSGSRIHEMQTPTPSRRRKRDHLLGEARRALQYAKNLRSSPTKKSKEMIFSEFVAMELEQINNAAVYNETKWKIQVTLMEGFRKNRDLKSLQSLTCTSRDSGNSSSTAYSPIGSKDDHTSNMGASSSKDGSETGSKDDLFKHWCVK